MAAKVEYNEQIYEQQNGADFDVETFVKMVALFDSGNAGEAQNAFRKAVVLCGKNGLRFCDAAAQAFGHGDNGGDELREQLWQQEAQHAGQLTEAAEEIQRLRARLDQKTSGHEHVIDFFGRLRGAWAYPQFRLLALTLAVFWSHGAASRFSGVVCLALLAMWSVAQFHRDGLGQMLLKWLVYGAVVMGGGWMLAVTHVNGNRAMLGVLAVALLLTFSKLSCWLGELVRVRVWESRLAHVVRSWF